MGNILEEYGSIIIVVVLFTGVIGAFSYLFDLFASGMI